MTEPVHRVVQLTDARRALERRGVHHAHRSTDPDRATENRVQHDQATLSARRAPARRIRREVAKRPATHTNTVHYSGSIPAGRSNGGRSDVPGTTNDADSENAEEINATCYTLRRSQHLENRHMRDGAICPRNRCRSPVRAILTTRIGLLWIGNWNGWRNRNTRGSRQARSRPTVSRRRPYDRSSSCDYSRVFRIPAPYSGLILEILFARVNTLTSHWGWALLLSYANGRAGRDGLRAYKPNVRKSQAILVLCRTGLPQISGA